MLLTNKTFSLDGNLGLFQLNNTHKILILCVKFKSREKMSKPFGAMQFRHPYHNNANNDVD